MTSESTPCWYVAANRPPQHPQVQLGPCLGFPIYRTARHAAMWHEVGGVASGSAFSKITKIAHVALIFLSMGGSRSHMAACATTRRVAVHFCRRHIGRPVSTSERDIPKKYPHGLLRSGRGPAAAHISMGRLWPGRHSRHTQESKLG